MILRQIADDKLAQYAYLIGCQRTGEALLIDPERDVDRYLELAGREGVRITAVAETHIHADFLSGARELAERDPEITLYLSGEGGEEWRSRWARDGNYRARFLEDGETFPVGGIEVQAVHTPGHTPEHLSYLVTDRGAGADQAMGLVTGDFVFVGDLGRPDLLESAAGMAGAMEPSARRLHGSALRFLELPDHLQVWPAHGAGSACGKALGAVPQSTVGYERRFNAALRAAQGPVDEFVAAILHGQPEPPLYFARMKRLNEEGVPPLGQLPVPRELTALELATLAGRADVTVLDTRADRQAFFAAHLPGALFTPLDRTFPTIAGSYVDHRLPIVLIVEAARREEAVRALVRIGLDRVTGSATPEILARTQGLVATPSVGFAELERRREQPGVTILDVRSAAEHAARHVPGALHIPHTRLAERLSEVADRGPVLVHCASGARAAAAAALLAREGFAVTHVDGAFADWKPQPQAVGTTG